MEFDYTKGKIEIENKILTDLDRFIFEFVQILENYSDYVIISGYVPILFGRTRGTEDVDVFIRNIDEKTFSSFYNDIISKKFYFLNPENKKGLFEMLNEKLAIRAAEKDTIIPNIKLKFIKDDVDNFTLENRVKVILNDKNFLYISPIEIEIPYKLYLGSEKDIEDAIYLWDLFKECLDKKMLFKFIKQLNVSGEIYGIKI